LLAERDNIVLWLSHIVISYSGAIADPVLRPAGWSPDTTSTRSREQAEALALEVAKQACATPSRFEELARRYSDDVVTKSLGGSLGGVRASQLPRNYLDALNATSPGSVSRIIDTPAGFAVLLHRAPPPGEIVAGRRVVIRYATTIGTADERMDGRSHADAEALAKEVYRKASAPGADFGALVQQYSEHGDRALQGDMGSWSTRDPGDRPREVEALSRVAVGQVTEPIDTFWGIQVLRREEPISHPDCAMAAVRFHLNPDAPDGEPGSRSAVMAHARALAASYRDDSSKMAEPHQEGEDFAVETWPYGHGSPELTLALDGLRFGEVATEPVSVAYFVVVPMRLDPLFTTTKNDPVSYELPVRPEADISRFFLNVDSKHLISYVHPLSDSKLLSHLGLADEESRVLNRVLASLEDELGRSTTGDARLRAYKDAEKRAYGALSLSSYSRFMSYVENSAVQSALKGP
jgi:hypothetical protein